MSYFPLEVGKTWTYHYRSSGSVASSPDTYDSRSEGTTVWKVEASTCTAGVQEVQISERTEGTRQKRSYGEEWGEKVPFNEEEVYTLIVEDSLKLWRFPDPIPWRIEQVGTDTLKLDYYLGVGYPHTYVVHLVPDVGVVYWRGITNIGRISSLEELELIDE